jgi:uncharacterized membrane protein
MPNEIEQMNKNLESVPQGARAGENAAFLRKVSWFIRFCAIVSLVLTLAPMLQLGLPHGSGGVQAIRGIAGSTMFLVMSFIFSTAGTTKIVLSAMTIVLGVFVMSSSIALIFLQH